MLILIRMVIILILIRMGIKLVLIRRGIILVLILIRMHGTYSIRMGNVVN